jgi:hypothetical protein
VPIETLACQQTCSLATDGGRANCRSLNEPALPPPRGRQLRLFRRFQHHRDEWLCSIGPVQSERGWCTLYLCIPPRHLALKLKVQQPSSERSHFHNAEHRFCRNRETAQSALDKMGWSPSGSQVAQLGNPPSFDPSFHDDFLTILTQQAEATEDTFVPDCLSVLRLAPAIEIGAEVQGGSARYNPARYCCGCLARTPTQPIRAAGATRTRQDPCPPRAPSVRNGPMSRAPSGCPT